MVRGTHREVWVILVLQLQLQRRDEAKVSEAVRRGKTSCAYPRVINTSRLNQDGSLHKFDRSEFDTSRGMLRPYKLQDLAFRLLQHVPLLLWTAIDASMRDGFRHVRPCFCGSRSGDHVQLAEEQRVHCRKALHRHFDGVHVAFIQYPREDLDGLCSDYQQRIRQR